MPPTGAEASDSVVNDNLTGLTMADYQAGSYDAEDLLAEIPLSSIAYTTPVLPSDQRLFGAPEVKLWVSSAETTFQIHAALFDVAPGGAERFVASGHFTSRGQVGPGTSLVEFPIYYQAYRFRAGHRIRVRLENVIWFRPPVASWQSAIRYAPVFTDFTLSILHDTTHRSEVRVPLLNE